MCYLHTCGGSGCLLHGAVIRRSLQPTVKEPAPAGPLLPRQRFNAAMAPRGTRPQKVFGSQSTILPTRWATAPQTQPNQEQAYRRVAHSTGSAGTDEPPKCQTNQSTSQRARRSAQTAYAAEPPKPPDQRARAAEKLANQPTSQRTGCCPSPDPHDDGQTHHPRHRIQLGAPTRSRAPWPCGNGAHSDSVTTVQGVRITIPPSAAAGSGAGVLFAHLRREWLSAAWRCYTPEPATHCEETRAGRPPAAKTAVQCSHVATWNSAAESLWHPVNQIAKPPTRRAIALLTRQNQEQPYRRVVDSTGSAETVEPPEVPT